MIKTNYIIIFALFIILGHKTTAQNRNAIHFGLGTEYRVEPFNIDETNFDNEQETVFVDVKDQLTGAALNYFVSFYWEKADMEFGVSQSLRFDHQYFDTDSLTLANNNIYSSKNGVISDYHLFIQKNFKLKREVKWNIFLGYSFMNRGTKYLYKESTTTSALPFPLPFPIPIPGLTTTTTEVKEGNFNMDAINFGIGAGIKKFSADIGVYYSLSHNYSSSDNIIVPRAKIAYRLINLNE